MKKTIYLICLLALVLGTMNLNAQIPGFSVSPQNQCISVGGASATAYVTVPIPGATSYSWSVFSNSCNASVSTFSNGSIANITYSCCGVYSIICQGFSGSTFVGSISKSATVSCLPVLSISGNTTVCSGNTTTLNASGASSYTWYTSQGTYTGASVALTPTATTCYSLVGSNGPGCAAYSGGCVTALPGNNISISGNVSICNGAYTTLYASGATNYTWLPGGTTDNSLTVSPGSTTCYTLLGMGCTGIVSTAKCVTVSSTPAPNLNISGNLTICAGFGTTLTASGANTYTWSTYAGTFTGSTVVLTPTANTCFTLTGSNGSGCVASLVSCITVSPLNNISINGNANTCSGGQTILYASGSTNYTWMPGGSNSPTIAVNPTVTSCYTLSGLGCSGIVSAIKCVTVSPTPAPNISISGNQVICAGTGATLTASGANSYTWITSQGTYTGSTVFLNPTATSCFSVIGSNGSACLGSTYACITVLPSNSLSISGNASTCTGGFTSLFASGGTNYTWMPGGSNSSSITISPTVTTCYTLSGIGCSGIVSTVKCVTVNPAPVISISGNTTICFGNTANLTASGASSYTWTTGMGIFTGSTIVLSPTTTTCYSIAATSSQGCNAYSGGCITVVGGNIYTTGNTAICSGSSATITAGGAQSYTWLPGNQVGSSIVVSPTTATCYTVLGYSQPGCTGSGLACVSILTGGNPTISGTFNICNGATAILHASGSNSYTWLPGGSNSPSIAVSPSATTCYTLLGSSCSGINSAVRCVTVGAAPVISISGNTTVCSGNSTTLTASGANSYTWNTSMGTFFGPSIVLSPTATICYSVSGHSTLGCGAGYSGGCVTVQGGNLPTTGNMNICSGSNTTLTAGGAQSYTWLPVNQVGASIVVTPTANTCYTVIGYSSAGCSGSGLACVSILSGGSPTISGTFNICNGATAILHVSGSNSYTWLPGGSNSPSIAVSPSATSCYTLLGSSCSGVNSAVRCVTVGSSPVISVSGNTTICSGNSTTLTASGANTYTWYTSNGTFFGASIVLSPTATTCYSVSGNSTGGCGTGYSGGCITVIPPSTISISGNSSICSGGSTNLFAIGALSYTWLPGNLTGSAVAVTPSASVCYTVVGTQSTGCVSLGHHCVQSVPKPTITTTSGVFCAGSPAILSAQGANSYTWLPFGLTGSSISITPSTSACYTVIGTNGLGCTSSVANCFSVMPAPVITVAGNNTICAGGNTTLSANGAGSFVWLPLNTSGSSIVVSPSVSTCYTVVGTNGNCSSSVTKCVYVQPGAPLTISGNNIICSGTSANLLASGANTYTWNTGSNSPFITVMPTTSACYTVIGTNANGCIGSAVKCISVQAVPSLTINGPGSICAGSNALLIASGASSYIWSTGSTSSVVVVSPNSSITYSVTGSNGICSTTKSVSVLVNPKPILHILRTDSTYNDSIICAGNTAHLYAMGANSYTWSNGATSQFIVVNPFTTTTYTVSGTNSFGCSNSNTITLFVSACTGLSENKNSNGTTQIEMYPNPSSGKLTLKSDGLNKINYSVFDLLGKEILKGELTDSKNIDLSNYANGTYIIRFEAGSVMTYKKLIIEK